MKVPVRQDIALTGEVNLRGRAMVIGGLKEKAMGAFRAGVRTLIVPRDNLKDVREIPKRVRSHLKIIPVDHMDEVLRHALALDDPDAYFRAAAEKFAVKPLETRPAELPPTTMPLSDQDAQRGSIQ
jgi:ATP-dependent Lon protease